jgi:hypothetical protein
MLQQDRTRRLDVRHVVGRAATGGREQVSLAAT